MIDIEVTTNATGQALIEGCTDEGSDFIDTYLGGKQMQVIDVGRIILPAPALEAFYSAARQERLQVAETA